ncbi:hypothetical protein, partial [Aliikangiella maris]
KGLNGSTLMWEITITTGASLRIDITEMLTSKDKSDLIEMRGEVKRMLQNKVVIAKLINSSREVIFTYDGSIAVSDGLAIIILNSNDVPIGEDFEKLNLKANLKLEKIKVYWQNYRK